MVLSPSILALLLGGALLALVTLAAGGLGLDILRSWDLTSGSEKQLRRERRTSLVSTLLAHVMVFEFLSLFFFIATCDSMHPLFTGAMCAAGTLNANAFGYPALFLKAIGAILCGIWLILHSADNEFPDYPLIRAKYVLLIPIALCLAAETALLWAYFLNLSPDLITSCCGIQFDTGERTLASTLASLPVEIAQPVFYAVFAVLAATGIRFYRSGKGATLFALLSAGFFVVSLAAIVSFISLYIYQLPSHHCPFCLLQKEYLFVGFPLYLLLFFGVIPGLGVGILGWVPGTADRMDELTPKRRFLCAVSLFCFVLFVGIATASLFVSPLYLWE